jgi:hypothetical protein
MSRRKKFDYESAMPDEEVSWRMSSTAGRKLQKRLSELDLLDTGTGDPPPVEVTEP